MLVGWLVGHKKTRPVSEGPFNKGLPWSLENHQQNRQHKTERLVRLPLTVWDSRNDQQGELVGEEVEVSGLFQEAPWKFSALLVCLCACPEWPSAQWPSGNPWSHHQLLLGSLICPPAQPGLQLSAGPRHHLDSCLIHFFSTLKKICCCCRVLKLASTCAEVDLLI